MLPHNLWGELPDHGEEKPPIAILKEQAELLSQMTNGTLHGRVESESSDKQFILTLLIVAPYIDYSFEVLQASHGIDFYPLTLSAGERRIVERRIEEPTRMVCRSKEEFEKGLARILASPAVRKVIGALLAQSRA